MQDLINKIFDNYRDNLRRSSDNLGFDCHDYNAYYKFKKVSIIKINSEIMQMYESGRKLGQEIPESYKDQLYKSIHSIGNDNFGLFAKKYHSGIKPNIKDDKPMIKDIVSELYNAYLKGVKDSVNGKSSHEFRTIELPIRTN